MQPALAGTRNVYTAAQRANLRRLIYTSSIGAVGPSVSSNILRTELDWHTETRNPYNLAKLRSEQEALHLSEVMAIPTIRLCPSYVVGPYDYRITLPTSNLLGLINATQPSVEGGLNWVDVRDAAEIHAAAVDCGVPGQRYIVGGTNLSSIEVGQIIRRLTGIQPRHYRGGRKLTFLIGYLYEIIARVTDSEPFTTRSLALETIHRFWFFDCTKAKDTFGLVPRGAEETIRDSIRWLLHIDLIKASIPRQFAEKLPPDPEW